MGHLFPGPPEIGACSDSIRLFGLLQPKPDHLLSPRNSFQILGTFPPMRLSSGLVKPQMQEAPGPEGLAFPRDACTFP